MGKNKQQVLAEQQSLLTDMMYYRKNGGYSINERIFQYTHHIPERRIANQTVKQNKKQKHIL